MATSTPRRAVILPLLSLSALTFFLDGLTFVVLTVISKEWPQWTGIEVGAVEGLIAFAGLAAIGAWKDVQGVDVWFLRRVSFGITWSLLFDIAQVVLLGLAIKSASIRVECDYLTWLTNPPRAPQCCVYCASRFPGLPRPS